MITKEELKDIQTAFTFWEKLSDSEKELLFENASCVKFAQGETMHRGENDCIGVFLVKEGELRAYILSEQGKEVTLYRLGPGDVCVLSASCILQSITFDIHLDAQKDSEVIMLRTSVYEELIEKNIYVENFTYKTTMERFSDVMWLMEQILFKSIDSRLAIFLLDEAAKTGEDTLSLTHEQIARYMGSAREVVSRMLKYFSEEGIVEVSRKGLRILDKKKLRKLI